MSQVQGPRSLEVLEAVTALLQDGRGAAGYGHRVDVLARGDVGDHAHLRMVDAVQEFHPVFYRGPLAAEVLHCDGGASPLDVPPAPRIF